MADSMPFPDGSSRYSTNVLGWVKEALREGEAFLKEEYGYGDVDKNISYLMDGEDPGIAAKRDTTVAWYKINRAGKVFSDVISGLTDIKPVFEFRTSNAQYADQSILLNKLVENWWINNDIDLRLGDAVSWSLAAGCGYLMPWWVPHRAGGLGDIDLESIDPRDVLPVRPASRHSLQDCLSVIVRRSVPANWVRARYPEKAHLIRASREGSVWRNRLRRAISAFKTPVERLQSRDQTTQDMNFPLVDTYSVYIRDARINTTSGPIPMGDPDTNWFYEVQPGERMYPRGRLVICTDDLVLSDGPNPYWHGKFPICKLTLDPYPWSYFGKSVVRDIIPLNELLNEMISKVAQAARKTLKPGVIADKNSISDTVLRTINTEREGMKLKINPVAGDGIKLTDPVQVPAYIEQLIAMLLDQIDDLSGTRGLSDLLSLKQMPSSDSIEKIQAAMTPSIRRRGRLLEAFLRDVAEQVKYNIFQFYSQGRRVQILGSDGLTFEDFDFDPGNLVPMPDPNDTRSQMDRAISHIQGFPFYVAQNTLLSIAQLSKKMMYLQLRRMGEVDHTSLLEVMEIPNIAQINERLGSEIDQKIAAVQGGQAQPVGRPPTGQQAPQMQQKGDGRMVVSESG